MRLGTMLVALGVGVGLGGAAPAEDLGLIRGHEAGVPRRHAAWHLGAVDG